jgi:metal-responsive CopG/Arc/MetJ family transcriptional regulator
MSTTKIAITIDRSMVKAVDQLVLHHVFPSRSRAIQDAVREKIERLQHTRLAQECAKLNPKDEKKMAEEGLKQDFKEWPEY